MKFNINKIVRFTIGVIVSIVISYSIASIIILGSIEAPFNFRNDSYYLKSYTQEEFINSLVDFENFYDVQFRAGTSSHAKVNIDYGNKRNDKIGYILFDIDVISEENVNVNINIMKLSGEKETILSKVNEGLNIFKVPLDDAKKINIEFLNTMPVDMTINQLKVSNQLIGILPINWYISFVICFIIILEIICSCILIESKLQKKIVSYIVELGRRIKSNFENLLNYIKEHKGAFAICFAICIFAYAYNLMNFSLGVEEERDIVRSIGTIENIKELLIREGRYGLYVFRALETLDGSFTVFVGEFLAVMSIFLNIVLCAKGLDIVTNGKVRNSAIVIFGGMLATLPFINVEIMCLSIMNAGVYFSMMLTTFALLGIASFYENRKKSTIIIATICTIFAMFFLESHNGWFITGTVLFNLVWVIANKKTKWLEWIKYVLHYIVVFVVAFVCYVIIRQIIGDNGYVSTYVKWGTDEPINLLKNIVEWIATTLTDKSVPGAIYLLFSIVIFVGFVLIYILKEKGSRASLIIFLSLCMIVSPFLLCFIAGGAMPYRTLEALMLLEAGTWFVVINYVDKKILARYILIGSAIFIIWNQSLWMNRIFYGADLNAQLDLEMGYSIGNEIERVVESTNVDKPVVFVGMYQHQSPNIYKIGAVGQSIFCRPRNIFKIYYMRYLGFNLQQPNVEQTNKATELASDMAVWPLEGSVKEFEDVIVVRLK